VSQRLHTDITLETALAMRYHRSAKTLSVGLSRKLRANSELRALIPELSIVSATPAGLPVAYGLVTNVSATGSTLLL
jgi:orotate phosphoribosyltransferase